MNTIDINYFCPYKNLSKVDHMISMCLGDHIESGETLPEPSLRAVSQNPHCTLPSMISSIHILLQKIHSKMIALSVHTLSLSVMLYQYGSTISTTHPYDHMISSQPPGVKAFGGFYKSIWFLGMKLNFSIFAIEAHENINVLSWLEIITTSFIISSPIRFIISFKKFLRTNFIISLRTNDQAPFQNLFPNHKEIM
jgi:hypothetical protein